MTEFCMNCGKVIDAKLHPTAIIKYRYKFHHNCEKHYKMIQKQFRSKYKFDYDKDK